eukprot:tig00020964_g16783.t1
MEMRVHPSVAVALSKGAPVVALESTIVSHGMPYPENVRTAREVEAVVRAAGAVPATIAILEGVIHVGLDDEALERLGKLGHACRKTSRRDLAAVVAKRMNGATTVSGTMIVAQMAGIRVFVTGGIGGVHRGGELTMDVSADLTELGQTRVCVVSAGVKSLLDIPRTLEVLETLGVPVVAYGADEFPAFFTRKSGCKAPLRMDTPDEVARFLRASDALRLKGGAVVAVPIPAQHEAQGAQVEAAIQTALREAGEKGVSGADVTPFLLDRVAGLTGGASLASNIALIKHNAAVGSEIAKAYAALGPAPARTAHAPAPPAPAPAPSISEPPARGPLALGTKPWERGGPPGGRYPVVVVGGCAMDLTCTTDGPLVRGTSNPGRVVATPGGVGRNIAEALARLGVQPFLVSAVGRDPQGDALLAHARALRICVDGVLRLERPGNLALPPPAAAAAAAVAAGGAKAPPDAGGDVPKGDTSAYVAIMSEQGEMLAGISDARAIGSLSPPVIARHRSQIASARMLVLDANLHAESLAYAAGLAAAARVPVWFEPVSVAKAVRTVLHARAALAQFSYVSPSYDELVAMSRALDGASSDDPEGVVPGPGCVEAGKPHAGRLLGAGVRCVVAKMGKYGILLATKDEKTGAPVFSHYPAFPANVVNVTGAGDSVVGGMVAALVGGAPLEAAVVVGLKAAKLSVECSSAISPALSPSLLPRPKL